MKYYIILSILCIFNFIDSNANASSQALKIYIADENITDTVVAIASEFSTIYNKKIEVVVNNDIEKLEKDISDNKIDIVFLSNTADIDSLRSKILINSKYTNRIMHDNLYYVGLNTNLKFYDNNKSVVLIKFPYDNALFTGQSRVEDINFTQCEIFSDLKKKYRYGIVSGNLINKCKLLPLEVYIENYKQYIVSIAVSNNFSLSLQFYNFLFLEQERDAINKYIKQNGFISDIVQ